MKDIVGEVTIKKLRANKAQIVANWMYFSYNNIPMFKFAKENVHAKDTVLGLIKLNVSKLKMHQAGNSVLL